MARISNHVFMLVLTALLLVCEIVVGRICRSLLIAVDSFHTLYVFLHLSLSALKHHPSSPSHRSKRLEPFGVLISALLMASQCVSISLEILTHLVQPEAVQHPLLSIVVGGASLIFNILVLAWRRRSSGAHDGINKDHLQDEALMFCNPEASSVLDPDRGSSESPNLSATKPVPESSISETSEEIIQKLPEEPRHPTGTEPTVPRRTPRVSGFRGIILGVIQDLLCSLLVLSTGLVLLLSEAHCHRPHSDCHLLVYLDAGLSSAAVLVLLSAAVPKLHRYGLLVLQAVPRHVCVDQVRRCVSAVPGVFSVHELHVWQMSDALLVASLHVHCFDALNATQCEDLIAKIKEVLGTFGIEHCTVQPELLPGPAGGSVCSLRCGKQCAEKLCCSQQLADDDSQSPKTESPVCVQEQNCSPAPQSGDEMIRDMVIENTYL
ncbi:proton-coupled zinc antiporter SLC30A1 [Rhinichthys klamathensis goyatoka]|uniref:proton-coupled zinc antiporter SLC30A1 n=1 Tax=Rhinichthys klamathensis goyatoka TaxID=3034132 RepID=UPI0024B624A1|nr:proton-coupled zinc antiporter SLC30A1 [Rhinichthys klamathensis goyatoka]